MDIQWNGLQANFDCVRRLLSTVDCKDALVVLPELFATGFLVEDSPIEDTLEATSLFLSTLAQSLSCTIQGSALSVNDEGMRQNLVLVYDAAGNRIAKYQKLHPFRYGGEHLHFTSGKRIVQYPINDTQVAPFICYDLRFPEVFRHAVLQGAELFCVVANWPAARQAHWISLLQARAIENQCFVVGVNRVGEANGLLYEGASLVVSPQGVLLAQGGKYEEVIECELDLDTLRAWRNKFPALQDIRHEYLGL